MIDVFICLSTAVVLTICMYLYFPVAKKYGMLAGVNNRSSHSRPTVTGAGFIFVLSYIVYFIRLSVSGGPVPWFFAVGLLGLATVSFIDDVKDVWFLYRLTLQIISVGLMLLQLGLDNNLLPKASVVQYVAAAGIMFVILATVNFYNFMDGINGMMGGLTLAAAGTMLLIDRFIVDFVDDRLIYMTLVPTIVFLFFNYRKIPKCFSGDVGSVTLGLVLSYMMMALLIKTGNVVYIFLFAVVYIEAGLTVLQRLFAGQNIFKPHRIHLFQLLSNESNHSQMRISAIYFGIQAVFGALLFGLNYFEVGRVEQNIVCWTLFIVLCAVYLYYKRRLMGGHLLHIDDRFVKQNKV